MQTEESDISDLYKKIQQQDELIAKLETQQNKLATYIQEFKQAIERKVQKQSSPKPMNAAEQQKIQKQLERQLQNAKGMLKNYQNQLKVLQKKNNKNKYTPEEISGMELSIKQKEQIVKELNDDIKTLTIVKRKQEKMIEKKQKNQDSAKLSKFVQEIRKQRDLLQGLKLKHQQKQDTLDKRKAAVAQTQKKYIEKCQKLGEKPLKFQDFKQRRVQKRKDESMNKVQIRKDPKKHLSVKQMINSHLEYDNLQISQKTLAELKQKKAVAQNSLAVANKRYQKQIQQLQQRLQVLKKENDDLNTRYLQKRKEKELIQTKRNMTVKRHSSKTFKKLDPIK